MNIPIVNKVVSTNLTYNKLVIASVSIIPYTSAIIHIQLYFSDSSELISDASPQYTKVFMPTQDYLQWNSDDNYLINYVMTKLNLTKA